MTNEEPIIRDNRKLDPTGAARESNSRAAAPGSSPSSPSSPSAASPAEAPGMAELKAENALLADELARAHASAYNVGQEYSAFVRRSKANEVVAEQRGIEKVGEALMSVLDDISLARDHGELEGPFKSVSEKLEHALKIGFGLVSYGAVGEEFDPTIHEALMDQPSAEVTVTSIAQVIQPGYRVGEKVLRPARVVVNSPA